MEEEEKPVDPRKLSLAFSEFDGNSIFGQPLSDCTNSADFSLYTLLVSEEPNEAPNASFA
jgi:hypothetical protein